MTLPQELKNRTWHTADGDFNSSQLEAMLEAIRRGRPRADAIPGASHNSDRRIDRATQLLRQAGLIHCAGRPRRWAIKEST